MNTGANRGNWSSRFGFVVAAAGSAIGLGNIWRFPYTAGENGGGAWVLVYLGFVVVIGLPVLLSELAVGRSTERNPVGAFKKLVPDSWWPWVGLLGVLTGFGILSFYTVIAGWTLRYLFWAISGQFSAGITAEESSALFGALAGGTTIPIILAGAFLVLTALVVRGGVSAGIERATKVLMPIFCALDQVGGAPGAPGAITVRTPPLCGGAHAATSKTKPAAQIRIANPTQPSRSPSANFCNFMHIVCKQTRSVNRILFSPPIVKLP